MKGHHYITAKIRLVGGGKRGQSTGPKNETRAKDTMMDEDKAMCDFSISKISARSQTDPDIVTIVSHMHTSMSEMMNGDGFKNEFNKVDIYNHSHTPT